MSKRHKKNVDAQVEEAESLVKELLEYSEGRVIQLGCVNEELLH